MLRLSKGCLKIAIAIAFSKHIHVGNKRLVIHVDQGVVRGMRHIHARCSRPRLLICVPAVVSVTLAVWSRRWPMFYCLRRHDSRSLLAGWENCWSDLDAWLAQKQCLSIARSGEQIRVARVRGLPARSYEA